MARTDELTLMHTDAAAHLGRDVTVYANPTGAVNTLTGADGATWNATATVIAVCHEAVTAARGNALVETRQFDFVLADLTTVCAASGGRPQPGRFAIEDPDDGATQWWYADRIAYDGDHLACRVYCTRGHGHNTEAA